MEIKLCKLVMIIKMISGYCSDSTGSIDTDTNVSRMALLMFLLLINIGMKITQPQIVQNKMTQKIQRMEEEIKNSSNLINTMQKQIKDFAGIIKQSKLIHGHQEVTAYYRVAPVHQDLFQNQVTCVQFTCSVQMVFT